VPKLSGNSRQLQFPAGFSGVQKLSEAVFCDFLKDQSHACVFISGVQKLSEAVFCAVRFHALCDLLLLKLFILTNESLPGFLLTKNSIPSGQGFLFFCSAT